MPAQFLWLAASRPQEPPPQPSPFPVATPNPTSRGAGSRFVSEHDGYVFSIQQVYGGQTFHLVDVAYQQKLMDDRVELWLGRIAAGDVFLVSQYDYLFMQNGFDGNPVGIFFNSPGMT